MKIIKLSLFELKKNLYYSKDWISNLAFLMINMAIIPFTISPDPQVLNQFFLSAIMTSILLGIVLITSHIFDEDASDGSLNQYIVFGLPIYAIYLSKTIAVTCEFILIITVVLPLATLFYMVPFSLLVQIWIAILLAIPLLSSISIFGALLTINLRKNAAISILLIFPLLISILISLSLAINQILLTSSLGPALPYIEMNLGLTLLFTPILCVLSRYLR
jgi:heme exporter protein B